jgi:isochorismate synthase
VVEARDADDWRATVARAIRQIRCGLMEKVVLARAVRLEADGTLDVPAALTRLSETYPSCTIFAIARRERTFMGATPERLVRLERGQLQATCLAGSSRRGANLEEDLRLGWDLLTSEKDLGEHAVVVRVLSEALGDLCERMTAPKQPRLLTVANIHHLFTPVCGVLAEGKTLLDAVERLHPTPAVGGAPREPALRFIRECEELDRGWYAAPVGWLDREGEGEFAVALRSALVDERQATLFAGCGVVADSDPVQEYAESRVKLHAMLAALTGRAR